MTTRVLTNKTRLARAATAVVQPAFKWLAHSLYQTTQPALVDTDKAPWWSDSQGQVRVALDVVQYAEPTSYTVAGTWPTPDDAAYLRVTVAPAGALAARALTVWIVRNETASTVTVAGVAVATKTIRWISTDSLGVATSLSLGSVP